MKRNFTNPLKLLFLLIQEDFDFDGVFFKVRLAAFTSPQLNQQFLRPRPDGLTFLPAKSFVGIWQG